MNVVKHNRRNFFVDEFLKDWAGGSQFAAKTTVPVNITENADAYNIDVIAPALVKENFKIEVEKNVLAISYEVKADENNSEIKYTRKEFIQSSFKRMFTLPETVAEEDINAVYVDGVLKIALPKKEKELPKEKRQIEIS